MARKESRRARNRAAKRSTRTNLRNLLIPRNGRNGSNVI